MPNVWQGCGATENSNILQMRVTIDILSLENTLALFYKMEHLHKIQS